jgi:hypothetical protein
MTPQEKDLITGLFDRLKQAGGQPKDPEAEALIRVAVAAQPDAPYLLTQTVLIQNFSLEAAQTRIAALERELAEAKQAAARPTSFLGGQQAPSGQPPASPWAASTLPQQQSAPPGGPWGQPPQQQPMPPQRGPWAQPAMPQPAMPQQAGGGLMGGGAGGFLRTAATAAAGVAGGALLYQGISSLFGSHGTPAASGIPGMPGASGAMLPGAGTPGGTPLDAASQASAVEQQDLAGNDAPWDDGGGNDGGFDDSGQDDGGWDDGDAGGGGSDFGGDFGSGDSDSSL